MIRPPDSIRLPDKYWFHFSLTLGNHTRGISARLMLLRGTMKTSKRQAMTALFPFLDDEAYQKLVELEEVVAPIVASRQTAPFKERLQRAMARLSEELVDLTDESDCLVRERLLFRALRDCRRAANAIQFLFKAGVIDVDWRTAAFELLADIAQTVIDRLHDVLGLSRPARFARPWLSQADVVANDENSGSGGDPPSEQLAS